MASGPLVGGGGDGSKENPRWADSKVYTRKSHKPSSKLNAGPHHQQFQPQQQSQQTLDPTTDGNVNSSLHQSHPVYGNRQPHWQQHRPAHGSESTASDNDDPMSVASKTNDGGKSRAYAAGSYGNHNTSRPPAPSLVSRKVDGGGQRRVVINPASGPRHEVKELRSKLMEELDIVRELVRRLEARELQVAASAPMAAGNTHSQLSANDPRAPGRGDAAGPHHRQASLSVATGQLENNSMADVVDKEKRTPKANPYYRNSEFLLAKDKFPHPDSQKKSKANGSKKNMVGQADQGSTEGEKSNTQIFKSCAALLSRLMKHKHGWVFNKPVDVKGLGLLDYHIIIKQPMDLGTIKTRLNTNWYKSPREFAEDVRLTFRNATTYNPKGQDVHAMAEQLAEVFEDQWQAVEAEFNAHSNPVSNKKAPPPPLDMRRILERAESTTHPIMPYSTPKALSYTPQSARSSTKKPKARDPIKRDMTYDEKQRLSDNLQNLPSEKLDLIVQIIKKRNSSMSQHDDEIEVDIDSVDTETLWELDRFVTNYKKSLSKNKRKVEVAVQTQQDAAQNTADKDKIEVPAVVQPPQTIRPYEKNVSSSSPIHKAEGKADKENGSSSSSDSSTDSGSSSSDSDSESSSS